MSLNSSTHFSETWMTCSQSHFLGFSLDRNWLSTVAFQWNRHKVSSQRIKVAPQIRTSLCKSAKSRNAHAPCRKSWILSGMKNFTCKYYEWPSLLSLILIKNWILASVTIRRIVLKWESGMKTTIWRVNWGRSWLAKVTTSWDRLLLKWVFSSSKSDWFRWLYYFLF